VHPPLTGCYLKSVFGHRDLAKIVGRVISEEYRKHVSPTPNSSAGSVYQILVALWCPGNPSALYSTWQGSIRRCDGYECIGSGYYLGRYLIQSMFNRFMGVDEARIVAAYTMAEVKAHVPDCGGSTHMVALMDTCVFQAIPWGQTAPLETGLVSFDWYVRTLLFALLSQRDEAFSKSLGRFSSELTKLRAELGVSDAEIAASIRKNQELLQFFTQLAERSKIAAQPDPQSPTSDPSRPELSQELESDES